jgi:pantothenate kinase
MSPALPPELLARAQALINRGGRRLLGIVGTPGSGKSTLAQLLADALGEQAVVVPMDGFHLANRELARLDRASRKGAPDTFDVGGYHALLARLQQQQQDETIYAPQFQREIEESIAGAITILPQTKLIISEGNYLLLSQEPWTSTASFFDECWFLSVSAQERHSRLMERHQQFGRNEEAAKLWIANTDEPNAQLIEHDRSRADFSFSWEQTF